MDSIVGSKIRKYRLVLGLSQENIAQDLGMSTGNYGKIERGEVTISVTHVYKIAEILKVKPTVFFEDQGFELNLKEQSSSQQIMEIQSELFRLRAELNRVVKAISSNEGFLKE